MAADYFVTAAPTRFIGASSSSACWSANSTRTCWSEARAGELEELVPAAKPRTAHRAHDERRRPVLFASSTPISKTLAASTTTSISPRSMTSSPSDEHDHLANVGSTPGRGARQRDQRQVLHQVGSIHRGFAAAVLFLEHVRRGAGVRRPVLAHQFDRVRGARDYKCPGVSTSTASSSSSSRDRRDRQDRRSLLSLQGRSRSCSGFRRSRRRRIVGLEGGKMTDVRIDYVAAAIDHIAHEDDLDGSLHLHRSGPISPPHDRQLRPRGARAEVALR